MSEVDQYSSAEILEQEACDQSYENRRLKKEAKALKSKFSYSCRIEIELTRKEVSLIRGLGAGHYDDRCIKSVSYGGFVYGWLNYINAATAWTGEPPSRNDDAGKVFVSPEEIDTVLKILETHHFGTAYDLFLKFRDAFLEISEEHTRINS
jgi:hypothetical protein